MTSADGTLTSVTVNILGTNDAPIVKGGIYRVTNIAKDGGQLVFNGQYFLGDDELTVIDPDGPLFGIAIIHSDDADGLWQYLLNGDTGRISCCRGRGLAVVGH